MDFFFLAGAGGGQIRCTMGDVQVEYKEQNFLTHGASLRQVINSVVLYDYIEMLQSSPVFLIYR